MIMLSLDLIPPAAGEPHFTLSFSVPRPVCFAMQPFTTKLIEVEKIIISLPDSGQRYFSF